MPWSLQQHFNGTVGGHADITAAGQASHRARYTDNVSSRLNPGSPAEQPREPLRVHLKRAALQSAERQRTQALTAPPPEAETFEPAKPVKALASGQANGPLHKAEAPAAASQARHSILSERAKHYEDEVISGAGVSPPVPNMCDPGEIAKVRAALVHLQRTIPGDACSREIVGTDRMLIEIEAGKESGPMGGPMCRKQKWVNEAVSSVKYVDGCVRKAMQTAKFLRDEDYGLIDSALENLADQSKASLNLNTRRSRLPSVRRPKAAPRSGSGIPGLDMVFGLLRKFSSVPETLSDAVIVATSATGTFSPEALHSSLPQIGAGLAACRRDHKRYSDFLVSVLERSRECTSGDVRF